MQLVIGSRTPNSLFVAMGTNLFLKYVTLVKPSLTTLYEVGDFAKFKPSQKKKKTQYAAIRELCMLSAHFSFHRQHVFSDYSLQLLSVSFLFFFFFFFFIDLSFSLSYIFQLMVLRSFSTLLDTFLLGGSPCFSIFCR